MPLRRLSCAAMLPLAVSGPAIIAVSVVGTVLLLLIVLRLEDSD
jgi:hypothetical protein